MVNTYTPALDGIRAFAVVTVIMFHFGLNEFWGGGQAGVSVFFVLSGFLITTGLLNEHAVTQSIKLSSFYLRRAARILPAFIAVIILTGIGALVVTMFGVDSRVTDLGLFGFSALAAVGQFANLVLAGGSQLSYELVPTWSLNVEEQFYILWSFAAVLLLVWNRARHKLRWLAILALSGAVVSLLWSSHLMLGGDSYHRVAYAIDTQAGMLLIGCFAAIVCRQPVVNEFLVRCWSWLTPLMGLVVLSFLIYPLTYESLYIWGQGVLGLATATLIILLIYGPKNRGPVNWVLLLPVVQWLGKRSYGLYLYHVLLMQWFGGPDNKVTLAISFALTLVLAELSYRWIEQPAVRWAKSKTSRTSLPGSASSEKARSVIVGVS